MSQTAERILTFKLAAPGAVSSGRYRRPISGHRRLRDAKTDAK